MKLLIDKTKRKVLFAEAGKECVDFLFHILSLPLGTVVALRTKESMAGTIGSIYGSLENLDIDYVQEGLNKDILLNPKPPSGSASNVSLLAIEPAPADSDSKRFYTCSGNCGSGYNNLKTYVSDGPGTICLNCNYQMNKELTYVASLEASKKQLQKLNWSHLGYVKGLVTYMIMDDLSVNPMSTIFGFALLNKFNVTYVGSLEKRKVRIDIKMGLALLKATLTSKTVLTDVFIPKKALKIWLR